MKEITFLVPDDSTDLVIELVEKLGGSVQKKKEIKSSGAKKKNVALPKRTNGNPLPLLKKNSDSHTEKKNNNPQKKVSKSNKKTKREKIDHTYLFGKWKDFDIDIKKIREELWRGI